MVAAGRQAGLLAGQQVAGVGAELGEAVLGGELPEPVGGGVQGAAVVEDGGGAEQQAAQVDVPHDPAGRAVPEVAVALADVVLQTVLHQPDEQRADVAVHQALGKPGRAGGVDDPQGRLGVELHDVGLGVPGDGVVPAGGVGQRLPEGHVDDGPQRRQARAQLGDGVAAVVVAAGEPVAVDREQDDGVELGEPVDGAARADVGAAGRPDGAEAGAGQQGDDGVRGVRQVGDDAVALPDAETAQGAGQAADLPTELVPRDRRGGPVLRDGDEGGAVAGAGEHARGEVEPGTGEPPGARHDPPVQHPLVGALDLEVVPHERPEVLEVLDRPAPQRLVVALDVDPVPVAQLPGEGGQPGGRDPLGGGPPQDVGLAHAPSLTGGRRGDGAG